MRLARLILSAHRTGKVVNLSSSGYYLTLCVSVTPLPFCGAQICGLFFSSPPLILLHCTINEEGLDAVEEGGSQAELTRLRCVSLRLHPSQLACTDE